MATAVASSTPCVKVGGHAIRKAIDRRVSGPDSYRHTDVIAWIHRQIETALAKPRGRIFDHYPKPFRLYGAKTKLAPGQRFVVSGDGQAGFVIAPENRGIALKDGCWFVVTTVKRAGPISMAATRS